MCAVRFPFVAAIILLAGGALACAAEDSEDPEDTTVTFRPHPSLSRRLLVPDGVEEYFAQRVLVYRMTKSGKKRSQVLADPAGPLLLNGGHVRWMVTDLNFDGYLDVGLLQDKGGGSYWLFNPRTGLFDFSRTLSDLPNVEADPQRRVISSHLLHHFGYEEYRFRKGQWVKVKEVTEAEGRRLNGGG